MDILKTAREIGVFETAVNLAKVKNSTEVIQKIGTSMPLPDENTESYVSLIADWLIGFGKRKYMFLTPEIALIEEIGRQTNGEAEIIIAIPCDLESEAKERLINNLPRVGLVTTLEEPYFPRSFFPSNGMIVISGYLGGNRPMVLHDTYRLVEHYSDFHGKKVFVPFLELDKATRYDGWMEIGQHRLNARWRKAV